MYPKFPGKELNEGNFRSHNSFLGHCLGNNLFLAMALVVFQQLANDSGHGPQKMSKK